MTANYSTPEEFRKELIENGSLKPDENEYTLMTYSDGRYWGNIYHYRDGMEDWHGVEEKGCWMCDRSEYGHFFLKT